MRTFAPQSLRAPWNLICVCITSLLVTSFLCSCAFKNKESAPPTTADNVIDKLQKEKSREASDGKLTKQNVSIEFVENVSPSSYQMVVRWPALIRNMSFQINGEPPEIKNNTDFAEFTVRGDIDYSVHMVAYGTVSAAPLSSITIDVHSPKDLVVDGKVTLTEDTEYKANRLFLESSGQILTKGYNLNINVNTLKVTDDIRAKVPVTPFIDIAKILTFVPDTLSTGERDQKGSVISINAKNLKGHLRIAMVGVKGRRGISGDDREKTLVPLRSRVAAAPLAKDRGSDGSQVTSPRGGTGRGGFDGGSSEGIGVCSRQPTNGGKGPGGDRGTQGGKGEKGGNCGTLIVNIENSQEGRIEVHQKPGDGGPGGFGGKGFPGGQGGLPGRHVGTCAEASQGPDGDAGGLGEPGDTGDLGDTANIPLGTTPISIFNLGTPQK